MRIGAVNYLNSKPLVHGLAALAPQVRLTFDLPSRLADSLAAGRLDVALIPSVEFFRTPGYKIVSDACVACQGPVLSVKLLFRVPPEDVRRVALDEGSRTSAALSKILLAELYGIEPDWESLPIGRGVESTSADAVLLIGDRAITSSGSASSDEARRDAAFHATWDLGEVWSRWAGLPFVFATWIARAEVDTASVRPLLEAARDEGQHRLEQIAEREARVLDISADLAERYLRDNLHFTLGQAERAGLRKFYELCVGRGLAPPGLEAALATAVDASCRTSEC